MKFDARGNAAPYPGNTIIGNVPADSPDHAALTLAQSSLSRKDWARHCAFLPPDSFHMTLYRGVNDRQRLAGEWPPDLPLDTPLPEVTAAFARRLRGVDMGGGFEMRPTELIVNPTGETQLILEAKDAAEESRLRETRARIGEALGHRRSGEDGYRFHITFCYRFSAMTPNETERRLADQEQVFRALAEKLPLLHVGPPHLCRYDDMLVFHPVDPA